MKKTIKILVALLICSSIANGQISRTASTFYNLGIASGFLPSTDSLSLAYLNNINNLTAQCWFKRNTSSGYNTLLSFDYRGMDSYTHHLLQLQFIDNVLTGQINSSTVNYTLTDTANWHHVALLRNDTTMYMYIDGSVKDSGICPSISVVLNPDTTLPENLFSIGSWHNTYVFDGNISDVRIDTSVAHIYYDTCNYGGVGANIYAALNNTDSIHLYNNGISRTYTYTLSAASPCATDTTADTTISHVGIVNMNPVIQEATIAPNPAQTSITISSSIPVLNVCIQNMLGQTVYARRFNDTIVNVEVQELPSGMYFAIINSGKVYKIVKQ